MSDMVKIRVHISTNKVGSECEDYFEVERDVWESMTEEEKEEICQQAAFNYLEWGWEEV
jgi:catalase